MPSPCTPAVRAAGGSSTSRMRGGWSSAAAPSAAPSGADGAGARLPRDQRAVPVEEHAGRRELEGAVGSPRCFEPCADRVRPERLERVVRHRQRELLTGGKKNAPLPVVGADVGTVANVGGWPAFERCSQQPAPYGNAVLLDAGVAVAEHDGHTGSSGENVWCAASRAVR